MLKPARLFQNKLRVRSNSQVKPRDARSSGGAVYIIYVISRGPLMPGVINECQVWKLTRVPISFLSCDAPYHRNVSEIGTVSETRELFFVNKTNF